MTGKNMVITVAKPHTIKKFELITRYVDEWARKLLGSSKSKGIVFIDCMSNSGHYYDVEENLVEGTAIRVARLLNTIMESYPGKRAWLYFNDIERERTVYLQDQIKEMHLDNINVLFSNKDRDVFLKEYDLRKHRYVNTLLLYDPYDASIDWASLNPFFNTWGEVILTHMVYDTARGAIVAKRPETIQKYQDTYQTSIEKILALDGDRKLLDAAVVNIIRQQTADSDREHFVAYFPFYNRNNGQVYSLAFCSGNIEGIKLFKKTAWKTFGDQSSIKSSHGQNNQFMMDFSGGGVVLPTDDECYRVEDIAKYIYANYHDRGRVLLTDVYADLDRHPVFPTDGYKREIKSQLALLYRVKIEGKGDKTEIVFC